MDYNDNEFPSQNLQLAGEGNTKLPPVLRPYALPKFDFDDSLHGHLRFDSLVETEVFLGIESNEDSQWIEEYSGGGSGIEFRTSAAESCAIARHNNVWSEATSPESVEMLLKSVGQEENIHGKSILREPDACDELGCVVKQMEPGPKCDDDNLSKGGDVVNMQLMSSPDEVLGNFPASKEDVRGGEPLVDVSFQKNKLESSVDGGLSDPVAVSGKSSLTLSKESNDVDQRKGDTLIESPSNRTEEDSLASGMQFDGVVNSAPHMSAIGDELNRQDSPGEKNSISENVGVLQSEIVDRGQECPFFLGAEINHQNSDGNVANSVIPHLENPPCLASSLEPLEERNVTEATMVKAGESSNMLKEEIDLLRVEGCNESMQDAEGVIQVPMQDFVDGDTSKVNIYETSVMASEFDNSFKRHGVEVGNANVSEDSLLPPKENKLSKSEAFENIGSYGGGISTSNTEHSATQLPNEKPLNLTSKCVNVISEVGAEDSSFVAAESVEAREGNAVSRQSDVDCMAIDVKESTELPSDCSNMYLEVGKSSTEKEMIVSKSHSDVTAGYEPAPEDASLVSHDVTEGVILPSESVAAANDAIIHQEVQMMDACNEESWCDAKEVLKDVSQIIHQEVQMMDACNEESRSDAQVVLKDVSKECVKEMGGCSVVSDSAMEVQGAEVQVISEKCEEATRKENLGKTSSKVSDAESLPKNSEMPTQPLPLEEIYSITDQKGQEDDESKLVSGEKTSDKVAVPLINGDDLYIHEVSISSTPLSESDAKFHSLESGSSGAYLDKSTCGSPTVIRAAELSQNKNEKQGVKGSTDQNNPASESIDGDTQKFQSVSPESKGNDVSTGDKSFTFEVIPLADSSEKEAGKNWQPFSTIQATIVSATVEGTPSTSGPHLSNLKVAQDASGGNLQASFSEIVHSVSKGTSEPKKRRTSTKVAGKGTARKGTARKGNLLKDTASGRQSEKGDRTGKVSLGPSGICQLMPSNEMQYMHVDGSMKPFVLATSASTLPDLNTSSPSMFQQPFTDVQQVQLRAQIFVYGALIQGIAPDEAYMISAFGGHDGGRSMWETTWRACTERLQGQKSHINNAETPFLSRSGARAPDQATKPGAIPSKVASSPLGQSFSQSLHSPIVNPIMPLSSPPWSIPTPSADTKQSSGLPRSPVMDYQQALSSLHAHQTPSIRNLVGHNTSWIAQPPFRGTWVASPQTSGFDTGACFPVLPRTETVQLTPVKEPAVPHSSGVKHVSSGPIIQSMSPAAVFSGTSSTPDLKKMTTSPSRHSSDSKPRKRKKTPVSEDFGQIMLHPQSHTASALAPNISSYLSTSGNIATPATLVSKASTEKVIMSVSGATSADHLRGNKESQQRASLSEETHAKLKEARTQAEDAADFAAAAVSHSQEIWKQLDKQKNPGLLSHVESEVASASVAIDAAAAVAKAAAAAAYVAASAALQAKLMADEALDSSGYGNSNQINGDSLYRGKDVGRATPASILKGENATSSSGSIIFAAREAARRQVEAASAASKKAENMDAIVKAAELAAEAVSQAGKIVVLGDLLPLDELIEAGPKGSWKVPQATTQLVATSNEVLGGRLNTDGVDEGPDTPAKHSNEVPQEDNREIQTNNRGRFPNLRNVSSDSFDSCAQFLDGISGSVVVGGKNSKGQKGGKATDLAIVPESEIGSRSLSITIQIEQEGGGEPPKENSIKECSCVEVFKEGGQIKAGWFAANVSSLKNGKAYVCYNELPSDGGGFEKLKEWVALEGEGDEAPKIRIARPVIAMPFEGTRKRRRAAMGEYTWSVGDRVDAWMQNSWWEGVVMEKCKKDETMFTVHFPVQGQTSAVRAWHLRPSLIWKDGEWVEWSSSTENNCTFHEGDTPQEKRLRLQSPTDEAKGKDKTLMGDGIAESGNPDEPTLLDLAANEKLFNIGKSSRNDNKHDAHRMIRSGLQTEGSRVVFGVPKPSKKRKFMDVSKHYVVDKSSKVTGLKDSVKFAKYLMPLSQGSGSQGLKNASRSEPKEKREAVSRPKVLKSGKPPTVSGRAIPQEDNSASSTVSASGNDVDIDHATKIKDFVRHAENTLGKHDAMGFQSLSTSEGIGCAQMVFSSMPSSSDAPPKKVSTSNPRTERVTKRNLVPAGGKLNKIEEDKVFSGNSAKTSEAVERRRSNRRIQPTSRLLEGLQSSLIISKVPSVSHDRSQKTQNRTSSKGNNHG